MDFFFLLSGFVIAKAYEARLETSMTFVEFAKVRFARLYPMLFVGVVLGILVGIVRLLKPHFVTAEDVVKAGLSALVLMPTTRLFLQYPGALYPINGPEWTLFFEFTVNFIYAPLVRWLSTKRLAAICALSSAALLWTAITNDWMDVGHKDIDFFFGFIRVAFPFFLGVLLFRCRPTRQLGRLTGVMLGLALSVVLLLPYGNGDWVYDTIAVVLIFPPIVFLGSACQSWPKLNTAWLWLGELSYPLYITHLPIVRMVKNAIAMLHLRVNVTLTIGACVIGAVIAAELFLKVWDRPVRKWLSGRLLRPESGTGRTLTASHAGAANAGEMIP